MKREIERKFYWRKLDDQAKVFALASNKKYSSTFRLSVVLYEKIQPENLQKALELALQKYKAFKVKMKKGFFWYYLEENEKKPVVSKEMEYPFQKINTIRNNHYLFKVTYFEKKINIDFFHALTDGNGGEKFLKEIIYRYLEIQHPNDFKDENTDLDQIMLDSENAYSKNCLKHSKKIISIKKAYRINGKKLPRGVIAINHFNIHLAEMKECTKTNKSTLSMYLIAMIAYSIYETNYKENKKKRPINVCVPVNLNKYFMSETMSNFFSYIVITLDFKENKKYCFEDILEKVKIQFEKFMTTISADIGSINKIFVRMIPLFLKKIAVNLGSLVIKRHFTMNFSNIGLVEVNSKYQKYIQNFFIILGPDWAERIKCGVCSYHNNLVVSFGTNLKESLVEKKFKTLLKERNITFNIDGNGVNEIN